MGHTAITEPSVNTVAASASVRWLSQDPAFISYSLLEDSPSLSELGCRGECQTPLSSLIAWTLLHAHHLLRC
jgi:hypothetical protein